MADSKWEVQGKKKKKRNDQLHDKMKTGELQVLDFSEANYKGNGKIKAVISNSVVRVFVIPVCLMVCVYCVTKLPEIVSCFF